MPSAPPPDHALPGWTVLSLRPLGQHASLRAAAARHGARLLALSTLAITPLDDAGTPAALAAALAAPIVLFTSPNAVAGAARLQPLRASEGQRWLGVGGGTARALARHGIAAQAPARMDSEGLLAMPALATVSGVAIGFVTAPGGRGVLGPALAGRGARVIRADVYARRPVALGAATRQRLERALANPAQAALALSSGEALEALLAQVQQPPLLEVPVVTASARLAELARQRGFQHVVVAGSARPAAMLRAAVDARATLADGARCHVPG